MMVFSMAELPVIGKVDVWENRQLNRNNGSLLFYISFPIPYEKV
jgi:hypothetical protein